MTHDEVVQGVRECLAAVLEVQPDGIHEDDRIIADLGADSLDLLDLVFRLEQRFQLRISPRDLERRAKAQLDGVPLELDGVYTAEALVRLQEAMPEVPPGELAPGTRTAELPYRFRVRTFVNLVTRLAKEQHG